MLDAKADLAMKAALDGAVRLDTLKAIQKTRRTRQDLGWIKTFVAAARGPGKLTAAESFYYGLERPEITPEKARRYVGKRSQRKFHLACNSPYWFAASRDKLLYYTILDGAGLPGPDTLAFLAARPRRGYERVDLSAEGLRRILAGQDQPVFAKPVSGVYSIGALLIDSSDDGGVRLRGHGVIPFDTCAEYMNTISPEGYLLQEVLTAHPGISNLTGGTVATVRILVIASEEPKVLSATLKLPMGSNVADNFWHEGNVLAAVDREAGTVARAVARRGEGLPPEQEGLSGFVVPDWSVACELVLSAATLFPPVRTQSWDVALTDRGPVLLEFNAGGDTNLHQLAHDRGILTAEYRDHLRRCGYKGKLD